jgi:ribosomal protein S18 acetylase RimI-like enzyme
MKWEFTPEVVDQVIYAMENQEKFFCLDFETGVVIASDEVPEPRRDDDRWYELPLWRSNEGFQLMERFVANLRNPIVSDELRGALAAGKGVFRQFKNTLKNRPEIEKLWHRFKEREMRKVVYDWFNQILEVRGLTRLDLPTDEPIDELILSDFALREGTGRHEEAILKLDREAFALAYPKADPVRVERAYEQRRAGLPPRSDAVIIHAEAPSGEFAGFVWGVVRQDEMTAAAFVELVQIAIVEDYRGLGLGKSLFRAFIAASERAGASRTVVRLDGRMVAIAGLLEREGFTVTALTMELDLDRWQSEDS